MSANYRVELSSSGRAICQSTDCKKDKTKIEKGNLRLGTWVVVQEHANWKWRHWGCITGKVLQNIREGIEDPGNPGHYRWDYLDGYDGEDKNGLQDSPELQAKVRRVITQGFIDDEDWNGDPEMNMLGQTGMRTKEHVKKAKDEKKISDMGLELDQLKARLVLNPTSSDLKQEIHNKEEKLEQLTNSTLKKKANPRKRKAADDEDEDDAEDVKPAPKKRGKAKQEVNFEKEDTKPAPKPKPRAKKAAPKKVEANSEDDEEKLAPPAKKSRAKLVKKEEAKSEDEQKTAPVKKLRAKKGAVKKEEDIEMVGVDEDVKPAPVKKPRAKKVKVKKEEAEDEENPVPKKQAKKVPVKIEQSEDSDPVLAKAAPKNKKRSKAAKKETSNPGMTDDSSEAADLPSDLPDLVDAPGAGITNAGSDPVVADNSLLEVVSPKVKPNKAAKAPANLLDNRPGKAFKAKAPAASGRESRSRTASGY